MKGNNSKKSQDRKDSKISSIKGMLKFIEAMNESEYNNPSIKTIYLNEIQNPFSEHNENSKLYQNLLNKKDNNKASKSLEFIFGECSIRSQKRDEYRF